MENTQEEEMVYTAKEVAKKIKVHPNYVYQIINSGELVSIKIGKRVRIRKSDLEDYIKNK
jgi:putative molybdopterin biosynthesis protein